VARSDGLVSYRKIVTVGVSLDAAWYSGGGLFVLVNGGLVVVVEWVAALAAAGGSALVGAAATDAWQGARDGVLALFGRGGDRRRDVAAARLAADAGEIEAADVGERDEVRARILPGWQTRLADLLEEYPEAREELTAWVRRVRDQLPAEQAVWVQNNTARDHGTVFAVQHGNQHLHQTPAAGAPASGAGGDQPR
jgi:hypothetical protein